GIRQAAGHDANVRQEASGTGTPAEEIPEGGITAFRAAGTDDIAKFARPARRRLERKRIIPLWWFPSRGLGRYGKSRRSVTPFRGDDRSGHYQQSFHYRPDQGPQRRRHGLAMYLLAIPGRLFRGPGRLQSHRYGRLRRWSTEAEHLGGRG